MFEEIAFNLLELGHSPQQIMDSEITFLMGYAIKKADRNKKENGARNPKDKDGWTQHGNKRRKVVTSQEAAAKARAQR